ncbi:MAG: carboxypeptidase-like regulatory domain-containing protein, partial [Flavobacteriales bacterium]|nr:carboxypeptidase-like regulatory domain-containing protein [Flavobacteriales bacterium]
MTHIRLLLLFSVWIFTSNAYSQNTECQLVVSGRVVDDHDRQPLAYAHVYIKSLNIGSVADSTGYYELRGLCAGTYQIDVSYIGTILPSTEIELSSSTTLNLYPEIHPEM